MLFWIGMLIGLFVGFWAGMIIMACCAAAGIDDRKAGRE